MAELQKPPANLRVVAVALFLACLSHSCNTELAALPRPVRRGLEKLECSPDQLLALQVVAEAHSAGRREKAYLSFVAGKRERRKAKSLISTYLPFLRLRKCLVDGSQCLRVVSKRKKEESKKKKEKRERGSESKEIERDTEELARHSSTIGGGKGKSIETIKKKEIRINSSDEGIPEGLKKKEKADVLEEAAGSVANGFKAGAVGGDVKKEKKGGGEATEAALGAGVAFQIPTTSIETVLQMQERHIKYLKNLVNRLAHIDNLKKQQADGKALSDAEKVKAGKRTIVYMELKAALAKMNDGELGDWKDVNLDFLGKVGRDARHVSPNYLLMLQCKDELEALKREGKLRRKMTRDPHFDDVRTKDTELWCPAGEDPDAAVRSMVWTWKDDMSGPFTLADALKNSSSSRLQNEEEERQCESQR